MMIGVVLEDENCLYSNVSQHFGQCRYFFLVDIENNKIKGTRIVPNSVPHGGGGCVTVDDLLKNKITHVIAGGMGMVLSRNLRRRAFRCLAIPVMCKKRLMIL